MKINITHIWCSTKIFNKVAFNDIHNKQKIFKVNSKNTRNTRGRCEMCLKLIVRTTERRR